MKTTIFILLISLFFTACSKSTVVLANNGKDHNAITINTNKGEVKLDKVGEYVSVKSPDSPPSDIKNMSQSDINKRFAESLSALPQEADTFIIYFENNGLEFAEGSKEKFDNAIKSIHNRMPCTVDIIGHTDTVGSDEINQQMSLQRAEKITQLLISNGIASGLLTSKGYGEKDLLIQTADNTPEAKNRSVEIFVK